uniref:Structural maintenance of chromosomes protein 2 (inferred by orthology to a human protein) n=1 Tax=Anisakis simplex TaxID=6269 RepID=A0A0M3J2Y3_ANISI
LMELETNVKKAEMRLKQLEPKLIAKKKELKGIAGQSENDLRDKKKLEEQIGSLESELKRLNFNDKEEAQIMEELPKLRAEREEIADVVDSFEARCQKLKLVYKDPKPGFDRTLVKGVVARLFHIKDLRHAAALEVIAGASVVPYLIDLLID